MKRFRSHVGLLSAGLLVAGVAIAGCGSTAGSDSSSPEPTASIVVTDAWIRASEGPMTGIFGDIANSSDQDVTIVSATNSASARTELHEMAMVDGKMVMQPKVGGVVLPAGSTTVLEPGGDHIMAMGMTAPVTPGDEVEVTLTLSSGETVRFTAVAKESAAGDEEYHGSDHGSDMEGDM